MGMLQIVQYIFFVLASGRSYTHIIHWICCIIFGQVFIKNTDTINAFQHDTMSELFGQSTI